MSSLSRLLGWFALGLVACAVVGCTATPLPTPPSAGNIEIEPVDGGIERVRVMGILEPGQAAGALAVRITAIDPEGVEPPIRVETPVEDELGSFGSVELATYVDAIYYLEVITDAEDEFLVALEAQPMGGPGVEVDPGPDSDDDGSPDAIDCAPMDNTLGGRRCMVSMP